MPHEPSVPCACTAVRKAARAISRVYDAELATSGLTTTQFAILRNLEREPAPPLSRLAEAMVMDRTSLYRTLRPMEAAGWISVEAAPRGRAKIVRMTAAGEAACARALPLWEAAQARFVSAMGIGAQEWSLLNRALVTAATAAERLRA